MSYADQLYLMQLDFQERANARRCEVDRNFAALREEERQRDEEREARDDEHDELAAPEGSSRPRNSKELQIIYYDEDEEGYEE